MATWLNTRTEKPNARTMKLVANRSFILGTNLERLQCPRQSFLGADSELGPYQRPAQASSHLAGAGVLVVVQATFDDIHQEKTGIAAELQKAAESAAVFAAQRSFRNAPHQTPVQHKGTDQVLGLRLEPG